MFAPVNLYHQLMVFDIKIFICLRNTNDIVELLEIIIDCFLTKVEIYYSLGG